MPNIVGTGFAADIPEHFVTCWHVAKVQDELLSYSQGELEDRGLSDNRLRIAIPTDSTYSWKDIEPYTWFRFPAEQLDVCVYRIVGCLVPPLPLQRHPLFQSGEDVGIIGFPRGTLIQGKQLRPFVLKTIIAGGVELHTPESEAPEKLALATSVAGGFSGGPVFSADTGEVRGMIASTLIEPRCTTDPKNPMSWDWPAGLSLAVYPNAISYVLKQAFDDTTHEIREALRARLQERENQNRPSPWQEVPK